MCVCFVFPADAAATNRDYRRAVLRLRSIIRAILVLCGAAIGTLAGLSFVRYALCFVPPRLLRSPSLAFLVLRRLCAAALPWLLAVLSVAALLAARSFLPRCFGLAHRNLCLQAASLAQCAG